MAKSFSILKSKMSHQSQARAEKLASRYRAEMALDELREARQLTQEALAEILNVKQSAISKLERRTDMYVSTLRSVIKGMGGDLRIEAVFPDGKVTIKKFRAVNKPARTRKAG